MSTHDADPPGRPQNHSDDPASATGEKPIARLARIIAQASASPAMPTGWITANAPRWRAWNRTTCDRIKWLRCPAR